MVFIRSYFRGLPAIPATLLITILSSLKSRVHNPATKNTDSLESRAHQPTTATEVSKFSLTIQLNISNISQTTQLKTSTSHPWNLSWSLHPYLLFISTPNSTCPCVVRPRPRNDWRHGSCCYPWASIRPRKRIGPKTQRQQDVWANLDQLKEHAI